MKSNLYAYFGFLGIYDVDSPGHTFYQLGLINSLKDEFGGEKFDFYSYYPSELKEVHSIYFPSDSHGELFSKYYKKHIDEYNPSLEKVIAKIENQEYEKIFLKARFRNLSTLAKKWDDTLQFEMLLEAALGAYSKEDIIILDTDLSLSEKFINQYKDKVTILIPSVDFPGIGLDFLKDCVEINVSQFDKKKKSIVFYGNLDTSTYKSSNAKNSILQETLLNICKSSEFSEFSLDLVYKDETKVFEHLGLLPTEKINELVLISRTDRQNIWISLERGMVMLNVSKDKYSDKGFIPARIFEALIFGMIPVSYKFQFLNKAFSFSTIQQFSEIMKYLNEVNSEDLKTAYLHFIKTYTEHCKKFYD